MFQTKKERIETDHVVTEMRSKIDQLEARLERAERALDVRRKIDMAAYNAERQAQQIVEAEATAQFAEAWVAAQPTSPATVDTVETLEASQILDTLDFFALETEQMPAREWLLESS